MNTRPLLLQRELLPVTRTELFKAVASRKPMLLSRLTTTLPPLEITRLLLQLPANGSAGGGPTQSHTQGAPCVAGELLHASRACCRLQGWEGARKCWLARGVAAQAACVALQARVGCRQQCAPTPLTPDGHVMDVAAQLRLPGAAAIWARARLGHRTVDSLPYILLCNCPNDRFIAQIISLSSHFASCLAVAYKS